MIEIDKLNDKVQEIQEDLKKVKEMVLSEAKREEKIEEIKKKAKKVKEERESKMTTLKDKTKEEAQSLLGSLNEIINFKSSIGDNNKTENEDIQGEQGDDRGLKEWVGNQRESILDGGKWTLGKEGLENLLRVVGFAVTLVGPIVLISKGVKKLRGGNKEKNESETQSTEKKGFWNKWYGKILKWGGITSGIYALWKYITGKKTSEDNNSEDSSNEQTPEQEQEQTPEQTEETPEQKEQTPEQKEEATPKQTQQKQEQTEQTLEQREQTPEQDQEQTPEQREQTPEQDQEQTPEQREQTPEQDQEQTPEQREQTPEQTEETPEQTEETPEQREQTPEQKEQTPEQREQTPEQREQKQEQKEEATPKQKEKAPETRKSLSASSVSDIMVSYLKEKVVVPGINFELISKKAGEKTKKLIKDHFTKYPFLEKSNEGRVRFDIKNKPEFTKMVSNIRKTIYDGLSVIEKGALKGALKLAYGKSSYIDDLLGDIGKSFRNLDAKKYEEVVFKIIGGSIGKIVKKEKGKMTVSEYYDGISKTYPNKNSRQVKDDLADMGWSNYNLDKCGWFA